MDLGKSIQKSIDLYLKNFGVLFVAGLIAAVLSVFTLGILAGPLTGGLIILVLKLDRGEKAEFNEIFAHFDMFVPTLLISIICLIIPMIIGLVPILGQIILIVIGPAISIIFFVAIAFALEKGLEPMEAVKRGYACFMTNPGMNWLYSLIIGIMASIGTIACFIGVVLTLPISAVGMTIAYQELSAKLDNPTEAGPSVQA